MINMYAYLKSNMKMFVFIKNLKSNMKMFVFIKKIFYIGSLFLSSLVSTAPLSCISIKKSRMQSEARNY